MRGIYQIRNTVTGDCYVGHAHNIESRWQAHKAALIQGRHHSYRLQRAWDTFGAEVFAWEVVEEISQSGGQSLFAAEARHMRLLPSNYNVGNVLEQPESSFNHGEWYRRSQEHDRVVSLHETSCPCCGLALNIETRIYPRLGRIIEVSQVDPKTQEWITVAMRVIKEDGTEVTEV